MTFAHAGLGVAIVGIVAMTAWRVETIIALKAGEHVNVGGYEVTYLGDSPLTGANYTGDAGHFRITRNGDDVAIVVSEKRLFQPYFAAYLLSERSRFAFTSGPIAE